MIIKAFNIVWFLVIALFIGATIFVTIKFKNKEQICYTKYGCLLMIMTLYFGRNYHYNFVTLICF